MSKIAIIPARGGSKRIPRKNIRSFCGRPIIYYSIKAALESGLFDTVMVSTDDPEIANISKEFGAEVPFLRSKKTSSDFATTADVLDEVLEKYRNNNKVFDAAFCLYATAPFVTPRLLKDADILLKKSGATTIVPVVKYSYPPQRAFKITEGRLVLNYPEFAYSRSQDLDPIYHDAGQFYAYRLADGKIIHDKNYAPLILSEETVQDIDNESDWKIAELKFKIRSKDAL